MRDPYIFGNEAFAMFEHNWEERGLVRRFSGHVTADELSRSAILGQQDPRFDTMRYVINDFRDCSSVDVPPEAVEEISATDAGAAMTNTSIRIATVSDNPAILVISDMYEKAGYSPYPVRNFSTIDAARKWLSEK
jgi:hypothetical protein